MCCAVCTEHVHTVNSISVKTAGVYKVLVFSHLLSAVKEDIMDAISVKWDHSGRMKDLSPPHPLLLSLSACLKCSYFDLNNADNCHSICQWTYEDWESNHECCFNNTSVTSVTLCWIKY